MSAIYPTWALQLYLSGAWVDVSADVRQTQPIVCEYGIRSNDPRDRVAEAGKISFALNNSARNSATTLGLYSPLSASKRTGFDFHTPVRWQITNGADTAYKFRGKLSDITPTPGIYDAREVPCVGLDWLDEAASIDLPDIAAQTGQRDDQLVTTIVAAMASADRPVASSYETGLESFTYALDGGAMNSARPKVRDTLVQIARSGYSYLYVKGDSTQGGTLVLENRHHRSLNPTVKLTLADTDIARQGFVVPGSRDDIYTTVQVSNRPTRIDAAATTVLYSLQTTLTLIQPGETNATLFGPYRDPVNNDQIGGTAQVQPVATTDYTMNVASDGSGANLTANFTVTATFTGIGVRFTIVNTGATAGYVTKLQVRGKGIYRYEAITEVTATTTFGTRVMRLEMPFQDSTNVCADLANYLAPIVSTSYAHPKTIRFLANRRSALLSASILREPGDRISISETVTGVNTEFTINGVRLELYPGGIVWCTWWIEAASLQQFWVWGIGVWGVSTTYGF